MLPPEFLRQIRRLQLRARRAVEELLGGEYRSVFRGMGIAFEEVREYQPGDDIRAIDWNVTARMGHPFVKRFIEERELTLILAVDLSASLLFGGLAHEKRVVAAELAALLAFSAISNNDKVGLLLFTDGIERYLPPRRGVRHGMRLIRDVLFHRPVRRGTSIQNALEYLQRLHRRRRVVFLLSDFRDRGYEWALRRAGFRHDLIAVRLTDPREEELPPIGLLELEDAESGDRARLDTTSPAVRRAYAEAARDRRDAFLQLARSARADVIEVATDGRHLDALIRFFRRRERRLRRP